MGRLSGTLIRCAGLCAVLVHPVVAVAEESGGQAAAVAAQAPATATPVLPAPRLPLPNRVNQVLPDWLRLRAEARTRMEGVSGAGFTTDREDLYWLTRLRVNATIAPSPAVSFQAQVQDARVAGKTIGPTQAPFRAPFDLRTAFADLGRASAPVTLRLGRQELVYGEQRLVGHVSWLNAARSFDAAKVTVRTPGISVDLFGASVVRTLVDRFDRSGAGNRFAGAYATAPRLVPRAVIDAYVFWKRDVNQPGERGAVADLQHATVGVRMAGRMPAGLDYGVEMAIQRGSLGDDRVRAWAGHWQLRESLPGRGAVKLTAEYNYASGDEDPSDGVRGTFDQLYPTPHDKTGLADQIGWKNIHHARAGIELTPVRTFPVSLDYHSWWLAERRDAVYAVSNAVVARMPSGAPDRHVGQEFDLQVSRSITPYLGLAAGYAHIFPGAFLSAATPGASYSHPYVMVTYVFLAEK